MYSDEGNGEEFRRRRERDFSRRNQEDLRRVYNTVEFLDRGSRRANVVVTRLDVDLGKTELLRKKIIKFFKE